MHRTALERVVEILAVRGRAVDECGAERIEAARVAERGAHTARIDGLQGSGDVLFATGSNAESRHVEEQPARHVPRARRHILRDGRRKPGSDGFRVCPIQSAAQASRMRRTTAATVKRSAAARRPAAIGSCMKVR
jgi:hypothetical protein